MDSIFVSIFSSIIFQAFIVIWNLFQKKILILFVNNIFQRLLIELLSLSLSNDDDDDTPEQIACFLSQGFILGQFTHLQSLSLYHIRFDSATYKILQLQQLTSLKIDKFQYQYDKENILYLFNIIWSLPKLIHCHLSRNYFFIYRICVHRESTI